MNINLNNFETNNVELYDIVLMPEDKDVGGGEITKKEIDLIKKYPNAKSLRVSGLNQDTFEYLINSYGQQFESLNFIKNKFVADLSLLGTLKNVKYIHYFYNTKAINLWDMKSNTNLKGIAIYDFNKLHSIEKITTSPSLQSFSIGNKVWSKMTIDSLKPICNTTIKHLAFYGDKVLDNDFLCLANSNINELDINIRRFTMDELAKIVASIPNLKGTATKPFLESSINYSDEKKSFYFLCKRKRTLVKGKDEDKLKKYLQEFENLIQKYTKE